MIKTTPWTLRAFSFGQPIEIFPVVLARLRGTPARAEDLAAKAPEHLLGLRVNNRWSVKEHLGHLIDLQTLDEQRLQEFLAGTAVLSPADMKNRATETANHNQTPLRALIERLQGSRTAWLGKLEKLGEVDLRRTALHPRLRKQMQLVDWLYFVAEHDDHHLAQVFELVSAMDQGALTQTTEFNSALGAPIANAQSIRDLFEIPAHVTYLNCANMAPQLRSVTAAGLDAVRAKAAPWTLSPSDWFSGAEKLRALAGRLLGTDANAIALVPAVSYGVAAAAANVSMRAGQSIVIMDREFPSNVYAWRELAGKQGGRLITVQREPGEGWTEALLRNINDNTAIVAIPQCHWTDGGMVDLVRVGERIRAVEAAFVIDASQSLGACPLELDRVQPDFLVSVGYKWLLGPYGLGYLYVAPKWQERGLPLEQSWLNRMGSEDFSGLVDYRDEYRPGARRFDMGEFPQFVLLPMAAAALRQTLSWGIENIQQSLSVLTNYVVQRAREANYSTLPIPQRCKHMIGVRLPDGIPSSLSRALLAAQIYVSIRGDSIRIAPHLYNDTSDIDRLFDCIASCLQAQ